MHTVVRILRSKYYITRKPSEGQCIRWQADTISLNKEKKPFKKKQYLKMSLFVVHVCRNVRYIQNSTA